MSNPAAGTGYIPQSVPAPPAPPPQTQPQPKPQLKLHTVHIQVRFQAPHLTPTHYGPYPYIGTSAIPPLLASKSAPPIFPYHLYLPITMPWTKAIKFLIRTASAATREFAER